MPTLQSLRVKYYVFARLAVDVFSYRLIAAMKWEMLRGSQPADDMFGYQPEIEVAT